VGPDGSTPSFTTNMLYLTVLVDAFRFISRYRDRQAALRAEQARERAQEREHLRLLVEGVFVRLVDLIKVNQEGVLKLAEAQAKQADAFATWLKGFQTIPSENNQSTTIRDEDEWVAEQRRLAEQGDPNAFPVSLPPEFQLAYTLEKLNQQELASFDREGRDF
jgi:hypothetical protein